MQQIRQLVGSVILLSILLMLPNLSIGQHRFRMKAEFSIKEKHPDGKMSLTMGSVYYDRSARKLVYQIRFPEKETWVISDTVFNRIVNGKLITRQFIPMLPSSTLFDFALSNNLNNFGLENSFYKAKDTKKDADQVITTWVPDERVKKAFGNVVISRKNNQLYGIAFYSPKDELLKKQIFKGYIRASGISFPQEITEIIYKIEANGAKSKGTKISTFKNLVVNDPNENNIYNFPVPTVLSK
jgi:hypothetical protein